MDIKQIMSFIKIEHTLFSLPFIIIGYFVAVEQFYADGEMPLMDLAWVLVAAVGARGLAMTLNRIIDKNIDAENPRTAQRHLASGTMSMSTAWTLAVVFLGMLLLGAGMLNEVALAMSWLPVLICSISIHQAIHLAVSPLAWLVPRPSTCRGMGCYCWRFSRVGSNYRH